MLGSIDKTTFKVVDIKDNEGVLINKNYILPFEGEIELPENLERLSILETHQGNVNEEFITLNIIVGSKRKLKDIFPKENVIITTTLNFNSCNDYCVCRANGEQIEIFSHCNDNDIIVPSVEDAKIALEVISEEIKSINNSVKKIKGLRK